ncbi:hypothetical protein D3C85_1227720 [compost metagenome]
MLAVRADPLQLSALQHAQQLCLDRQWQLADLIEEEGAFIGQFELALALVHRAGESAPHMAEQFALYQGVGQGGAVEADQRMLGAQRAAMDGLGHQFLADAGFAADQHGEFAAAHQGDLFEQCLVGRALPDHFPRADLASGLAIDLRQLLLVLGAAAEAVHALDGFHRCRRQAGEAFQHLQVLAVEACRVHGIQRQQSPGAIVQVERAT